MKTANYGNNTQGVFIQNVLPGPLVMCDPPFLKNGLYLDPLQPGEVIDLSYYDPQILSRSIALNNAIKNGYAEVLSENEYYTQIELAEQRQIAQTQELQQRIVAAEAAGNTFEAEQINLATAGNPHGDYSAEALLAQKNTVNDHKVWAIEYHKAKAAGQVRDPIEFKELVESGRINTQINARGRRVSLEMQNFGSQDQLTMTSTKATIAMPGAYTVQNTDGTKQEMGGVFTEKRGLTNFNATGTIVGANTMGVEDAPSNVYSGHPMNRSAQSANELMAEEVDINQDEDEYEQDLVLQRQQVADRLAPRSPYVGQKSIGQRR